MQMGVTVDKYQTRINAATKPVDQAAVRAGSVSDKAVLALDPRVNNSVLAVNRLLAAGATVSRSTASVTTNAGKWPAGTFLVPAKGDVRKKAAAQARQLGLNLAGVDKVPDSARKLTAPRVGLYYPWGGALSEEEQARGAATVGGGSRDEGWTRYTLEKFGFNQDKLTDQKVRAGNLKKNYDVIVLPDASYAALRDGQKPGSMPEEYTGGMTEEGVAHLKEFVKQGGTLVTFNNAEELARKGLGVPVKDVTEGKKETEFFAPGTLLNMQFDANQPIAWGMPEKGSGSSPTAPPSRWPQAPTRCRTSPATRVRRHWPAAGSSVSKPCTTAPPPSTRRSATVMPCSSDSARRTGPRPTAHSSFCSTPSTSEA